jgi:hypothetical protein
MRFMSLHLRQALSIVVAVSMMHDFARADNAPRSLIYDSTIGSLSAAFEETPATALLLSIGDVADLRVRVRGEVGTVRAQSFDDLPLDEAIQRLFKSPDRSLVMLYEATPEGGQRLAEVRLAARAAGTPRTPQPVVQAPAQLAAAPPTATPPPPPMHLRLPPPPPPQRWR